MPFIKRNKLTATREKRIRPDGSFGNYKRNNPQRGVAEKTRGKLISVDNITMSYDGHEVIGGLAFDVFEGDYICVVGENGSGKSTLIDGILGLKSVDAGSIEYCGDFSRKMLGFLPQRTEVQADFPATVMEIVLSGCCAKARGGLFFGRESRACAFRNMEKLGITSIAEQSYRNLSGGQQQRVLLARALCAAERLLILDEPVTGLDPRATKDMYAMLDDINKSENMALIMITHDMNSAVKYADKILYLGKNRYFFGKTEEFLEKFGEKFSLGERKSAGELYGESEAYRFGGGEE